MIVQLDQNWQFHKQIYKYRLSQCDAFYYMIMLSVVFQRLTFTTRYNGNHNRELGELYTIQNKYKTFHLHILYEKSCVNLRHVMFTTAFQHVSEED